MTTGALPLADRWATSRVLLPPALADRTYRDIFTGAEIQPATSSTGSSIFVGQALKSLPVAVLVATP
jgi:maltooligosyltrehalose synthase